MPWHFDRLDNRRAHEGNHQTDACLHKLSLIASTIEKKFEACSPFLVKIKKKLPDFLKL